jgi:ABC-type microcin C transport system permease subunit YejB
MDPWESFLLNVAYAIAGFLMALAVLVIITLIAQ